MNSNVPKQDLPPTMKFTESLNNNKLKIDLKKELAKIKKLKLHKLDPKLSKIDDAKNNKLGKMKLMQNYIEHTYINFLKDLSMKVYLPNFNLDQSNNN